MTARTAPPLGSFRGLAPVVAIPAAVVLVCVLTVRLADVDLVHWDNIHGDTSQVWAPQGVYGDNWDVAAFEPFSGGRLGWQELVMGLVAYGGAFVIGERILRTLVRRYRWPLAVRIGGGYLVGYLPIIAFVRLVTLRLDTDVAPRLCLITLGLVSLASFSIDVYHGWGRMRRVDFDVGPKAIALALAVVSSFAAIIVWTVQSGRNYLVSDSVLLFLRIARGDSGPLDWLPPFGRQMDEFLFNYPMIYARRGADTFAVWFWLTDALAKASLVWLIVGIVLTLTKGRWSIAFLSSALVLFASPIANPRYYASIIGGENPVIFLGHAGRHVGIVLPFLMVLALGEGTRRSSWFICGGLGLALMTTSPHNALFAFVTGLLLAGIVGARRLMAARSRLSGRSARRIVAAGAFLAIGGPFVTYGTYNRDGFNGIGGVFLLVGFLGAVAASIALALQGEPETGVGLEQELPTGRPSRLLPLAAGSLVGLTVMGNVFYRPLMKHESYASAMRRLFPAYREDPLLVATFAAKPFTRALCVGVPSPACGSFSGWVTYFGPTFFAGIAGLLVLALSLARRSLRQRDAVLLLLQFAMFELGLFLTDFMGAKDGATYWIQSRFIEVGYYGILILLPVILWNHLTGRIRLVSLATASVWFIVPIVSHPMAGQFWANLKYLVRVL